MEGELAKGVDIVIDGPGPGDQPMGQPIRRVGSNSRLKEMALSPRSMHWTMVGVFVLGFSLLRWTSKLLLSSFGLTPWQLIFGQSLQVFMMMWVGGKFFGISPHKPLGARLIRLLNVLPLLYFLSLWTSYSILEVLSLPSLLLWQNVPALITTFLDHRSSQRPINSSSWIFFFLTLVATYFGTRDELADHSTGLFLLLIFHMCLSVLYSAYHKKVMQTVDVSEFTIIYYNNAFALPLLIPFILYSISKSGPIFYRPYSAVHILVFFLNGFCCYMISVCSCWMARSHGNLRLVLVSTITKTQLTLLTFLNESLLSAFGLFCFITAMASSAAVTIQMRGSRAKDIAARRSSLNTSPETV